MKVKIEFCLILFLNVYFVRSDCGCNQIKREIKSINYKNGDDCGIFENDFIYTNMSLIPGGVYKIGCAENDVIFKEDKEFPQRTIKLDDFYLDKYEVSNDMFQRFISSTSYVTEAEKFGDSFVFQQHLSQDIKELYRDFKVVNATWWYKINGSNWNHPYGSVSGISGSEEYPVVHVSWNDANAYCKWIGKRLPTEAEWEVACRGGKENRRFPWGNKFLPNNKYRMNIWQGKFPSENTQEDGFKGLCPINTFSQNSFNLHNIVGNVWEWTQDLWNIDEQSIVPNRVKKGGSYLCHKSYCYRYRCCARSQNTQDSSADNLGFRCAKTLRHF